ncbi:MAG: glutathione S-transferase N-terminal domain-containing protein [Methylobacterium sp.]|nr:MULTISPECIES: glutathione S-transferase N-terminal domain-containing protein [unclassified Methylobacterium]MBP32787.1 glutathione S-transferase [Methylobacterium sp.]MBX9933202.1 glutathione S-transferase N-terminal domain-containing protein [Methylobacterium sp.]RUP22537.1 MAG: glutathione S-transferase family protein [Methylobacterium sp.]WFS05095.1 glutathione S-transferase N-terminal domain-containing protein [Methylobacterium sp. 391_Methyba4]
MIDLYAFATPNSVKVPILLEELGVDYVYHPVNIRQGEQKASWFQTLNPNGKVPVIVDSEGPGGEPLTITESAAILVYLAEKSGRFLAREGDARVRAFEWLFFHAAGLGPAFGQSGYFQKLAPEPIPAAIERFHGEARRTLNVLDGRLAEAEYLAGTYSIADIAKFGWVWRREFANVDLAETPHVERWYAAVEARPAVQRAIGRL